jgi:two-component system, NarL family, response regulator LiaR
MVRLTRSRQRAIPQVPRTNSNLAARGQESLVSSKGAVRARCRMGETSVELGMRKHVLLYGLLAGVLIVVLQLVEYRWLVVEHSVEIYGGLVAAVFATLGIWLGLRLTQRSETVVVREVMVPAPVNFVRDQSKLESLGITPRELEILELIAQGLSNKEIATRVYVSENTVKTHSSRVFDKLGARRRTQAVQLGKELRLIP